MAVIPIRKNVCSADIEDEPDQLQVQKLGSFFYGSEGPIVLLKLNDQEALYDREGLGGLIYKYRALRVDTTELETIWNEAWAQQFEELPDLTEDDLSGQGELFNESSTN